MGIARFIDHTLLKPDATDVQIRKLCAEAKEHGFASVCVNPAWVKLCVDLLDETNVKVCTVIGFPLGANASKTKAYEASVAYEDGAREIDMVINIGALKSDDFALVERDMRMVLAAAPSCTVKVIIETCLLSDEEKVEACRIAQKVGVDFVKTSTGFSTGGATVEDVRLMRATVGANMGIKASGGIKNLAVAQAMIDAGATRLGCSAGVAIVTEAERLLA
jgi:deoxyribose-phosphate aldolase